MFEVDLNAKLVNLRGDALDGDEATEARFLGGLLGFKPTPGIAPGRAAAWARELYATGVLHLSKADRKEIIALLKAEHMVDVPNIYRDQVIDRLESATENDAHTENAAR